MTETTTIQEQAALINYGIFSTNPNKRKRYELLQGLQLFTRSKYQRWCNVLHDAVIAVADEHGNIALRNVQTCQSRHSCPVCTNRFMAEQRSALNLHVTDWQNKNGQIIMGTLTIPNRTPMDFRYSYARLVEVGATFRRLVKKLERELGVPISVRVIEETIQKGRGIHAHFHFLWFLPTDGDAEAFMEKVKGLWLRAAKSKGISGVSAAAQNLKVVQPGDGQGVVSYITKHGYTPTSDASDLPSNGPLSPFEALVAATSGDLDWMKLWHLFEAAVKGKHRITFYENAPK
jgi:hypothetical protein